MGRNSASSKSSVVFQTSCPKICVLVGLQAENSLCHREWGWVPCEGISSSHRGMVALLNPQEANSALLSLLLCPHLSYTCFGGAKGREGAGSWYLCFRLLANFRKRERAMGTEMQIFYPKSARGRFSSP